MWSQEVITLAFFKIIVIRMNVWKIRKLFLKNVTKIAALNSSVCAEVECGIGNNIKPLVSGGGGDEK